MPQASISVTAQWNYPPGTTPPPGTPQSGTSSSSQNVEHNNDTRLSGQGNTNGVSTSSWNRGDGTINESQAVPAGARVSSITITVSRPCPEPHQSVSITKTIPDGSNPGEPISVEGGLEGSNCVFVRTVTRTTTNDVPPRIRERIKKFTKCCGQEEQVAMLYDQDNRQELLAALAHAGVNAEDVPAVAIATDIASTAAGRKFLSDFGNALMELRSGKELPKLPVKNFGDLPKLSNSLKTPEGRSFVIRIARALDDYSLAKESGKSAKKKGKGKKRK